MYMWSWIYKIYLSVQARAVDFVQSKGQETQIQIDFGFFI
jgi:hypothetical protein